MKKVLLACLLALPLAAADLSSLAVKTVSRSVAAARTFKGSGMLFRQGGKTYVVTSDHVILHGGDGYLHRIASPTLGERRVRLVVAEWAVGLALLEVEGLAPSADLPELAQLGTPAPAQGEPVVLVGYPLNSDQPIEDPRGRIGDPRFESPLFYSVPHLIQVIDAHGEFGMSGGPLFSANGAFLGLLSHQIVKDGPRPENKLLVIPAPAVQAWLSGYFRDPAAYQSAFVVPPRLQFQETESVIVRDIQFTDYRGLAQTYWLGVPQTPIDPHDPTGVLERVRDFSRRNEGQGSGVSFSCFRKRGEIGGRCLALHYRSLAELFRLLARADIEPVTKTGINDRDAWIEKLRASCRKLQPWTREHEKLDLVVNRCNGSDYPTVKPIDLWVLIQEAKAKQAPYEKALRELLAVWRKLTV